ncbi:RING zinc finger protein, putative [Plasmodium ovale]|uniref:RING-type E3 ubiquitin transferase n=2 Tax=Plasmodium ovale TaxID=36330 RepID=A0A1A8VL58_PLAOA|nr:RING zinc finger protein [Plasmodium ovale curtisi]SBS81318.1 RING zinc finger protein [Plasmodium ovale curtisi]SCN43071.1 RING zinc finger protein, putative [Plasmodium ovale]
MGIIGSSLAANIDDDFHNDRPRTVTFNSSIINRTDDEHLYDLMSQGPNINIQRTSVVRNSVNLRRKTLRIINNGNNVYLINFIFDALYDVEISTYFCCKEEFSEAQEAFYTPTKYRTFTNIFPKQINQIYISKPEEGINLNLFDVNDLKCKPSYEYIVPILIVLKAIGAPVPQAQYNFAYLQENEMRENIRCEGKYKIVLYRQKIQFGNKYFEVQEIFGIEKSKALPPDPVNNFLSGRECVICLTEERDTAILPCRHMCLCNVCANVVRMQNTKCPICRQDVRGLLQISIDNKKDTATD